MKASDDFDFTNDTFLAFSVLFLVDGSILLKLSLQVAFWCQQKLAIYAQLSV